MINKSYDKSVFINCPYDVSYNPMLHSMLFTIVTLGYYPRLALESSDAGIARLDKITQLIIESKISIHDLSRIKTQKKKEFFRLNMPFELGMDFGCRRYSDKQKLNDKKYLIIGSEPYEYMKALSDISGIDIEYHYDDVSKLVKTIRHWFVKNFNILKAPSPNEIWYKFMDFNGEYIIYIRNKGYKEEEMYNLPLVEQIEMMNTFLVENPY